MRKPAKTAARLVGITAALLGTTLAFSTPASAAGDTIYWASNYKDSRLVGDAKFYSDGEGVRVWDDAADGFGIVAHVDVRNSDGSYSRWKNVYNVSGIRTSVFNDSGDIAEGRGIRLRTCSWQNSAPVYCGPWVYGSA